MKQLLILTLASLPLFSQEPTQSIQLAENSPLAQAIARSSDKLVVKSGSKILIEITAPVEPQKTPTKTGNSTNKNSLSLLNYRGKRGAPSSIAQAATRSGDAPDIRIIVLSPSEQALTHLEAPRLWWHQSSPSEGGELEFILTQMTPQGGREIFRRLIPPMGAGFNVIDLSHPAVNPGGISLESDHAYQWTINLRDGDKASPAYSKLRYQKNNLTPKTLQPTPALMTHLSQSGNWHETLDLVATQAKLHPDKSEFSQARDRILKEADLLGTLKKKP